MSDPRENFAGAKLILFLGDDLLVLRRDHTKGIPWPGYLDFPGGGREGRESPEDCAHRETLEETGLDVPIERLRCVQLRREADVSWFFAAHLNADQKHAVRFGGEGAGWDLMAPHAFIQAPDAIPHFAQILADYLQRLEKSRT